MSKITEYTVVMVDYRKDVCPSRTVNFKTKAASKEQAIARAQIAHPGCKVGYLLA